MNLAGIGLKEKPFKASRGHRLSIIGHARIACSQNMLFYLFKRIVSLYKSRLQMVEKNFSYFFNSKWNPNGGRSQRGLFGAS